MPKGMTTVNKCGMYFECFIPLTHAFNHFPYKMFLIWTSFCPTFIYYFDKTLNAVANSSCMPCLEVKLGNTLKHVVSLCYLLASHWRSRSLVS